MKKTILITTFAFLSFTSSAQIALNTGVGFNKFFGGTGISNFGLYLGGEYSSSDENSYTGSIQYFLPDKYQGTTTATASSSATTPSTTQVDVTDQLSAIQLSAGYKRYFVGEFDDKFNFYGTAQVGLVIAPYKFIVDESSYDKAKYNLSVTNYDPSIPGSKETFSNFTFGGGIGAELEVSRDIYVTGEASLIIPYTDYNSRTGAGAYEVPGAGRLFVGLKFIL